MHSQDIKSETVQQVLFDDAPEKLGPIPKEGHCLMGECEDRFAHRSIMVEPSTHPGFFYVSVMHTEKGGTRRQQNNRGASIDGSTKPIRSDFIGDTLQRWGVRLDEVEWLTGPSEPHIYNRWLFNSHEEYVQKAILGGGQ